jgi:hypothetical protein
MGPLTAGLIGAGLGFGLGGGGKKKKYKPPPLPKLSAMGRWAQGALYGDIERGLAGQGLTPDLGAGFGRLRGDWLKSYGQTRMEFEGQLNRMIPRGDTKVRGYLRRGLRRGYLGGLDELRREELGARYDEQQEALAMGQSALAQEKRMATDITQIYNQQQQANLMNRARFGTFGMNLASGIGGMAGWLMPSSQMSASQKYAMFMSGRGYR